MANLVRLRNELGWSQRKLAEVSGTSAAAGIEWGKRLHPRYETLHALAGALGVTVADLYADPPRSFAAPRRGVVQHKRHS